MTDFELYNLLVDMGDYSIVVNKNSLALYNPFVEGDAVVIPFYTIEELKTIIAEIKELK